MSFGGSFTMDGFTSVSLLGPATMNNPTTITTTNPLSAVVYTLGPISGGGSLTKSGPGLLVLNAPNSYAGATSVTQGELKLGAVYALPSGNPLNIASGAIVDMNGFSQVVGAITGPGALVNSSVTAATLFLTGTGHDDGLAGRLLGPLPTAAAMTLNLAKIGTGTIVLAGPATDLGSLTVQSGTLQLGADQTWAPTTTLAMATLGRAARPLGPQRPQHRAG